MYSNLKINFTHFVDQEIDEVALFNLTETMIRDLLPKIGQRAKFLKHLEDLKIQKVRKKFNISKPLCSS